MIRIVDSKSVATGIYLQDINGLSTDDKPTTGIATGSSFFEVDTGDVYFFDEESGTWINPDAEEE